MLSNYRLRKKMATYDPDGFQAFERAWTVTTNYGRKYITRNAGVKLYFPFFCSSVQIIGLAVIPTCSHASSLAGKWKLRPY
jgi:hypothetical protein